MQESVKQNDDLMKVADIVDWSQGYDEDCVDLIKTFKQFYDAYYHLMSYSNEWWESFNQSCTFNDAVKKEWDKLDNVDIMSIIDTVSMLITGAYTQFDKFAEGVEQAFDNGYGYRRKKDEDNG